MLFSFARRSCTLALSEPKAVSSWKIEIDPNFCPVLALKSFRNSNMSREKCSSVGEVRKKYLRPRCVRAGCEDSGVRKGMPARSAAWLAAAVTDEW